MKLDDELLLTDWKSATFNPYEGCEDMWEPKDGYIRKFGKRGDQKRIFGQFAMKFCNNNYRWVPAIVNTGARSTHLCRRSLKDLGVPVGDISVAPKGYTIKIGDLECAGVTIIEDQGVTASGHGLDGDVNIIGMDVLGSACVAAIRTVLEVKLGHPAPAVVPTVWVCLSHNGTLSTPFMVAPTVNNIDSLKKAVKAKNNDITVPSRVLVVHVYNPTTKGWEKVNKQSTPLLSNTEETAYHVVVPDKQS